MVEAKSANPEDAHQALNELCRRYWHPIYSYLRFRQFSSHDAKDLTQGFFVHLLSRDFLKSVEPANGRFRSFLLASLKNFLSNERERAAAQKRGGEIDFVSLESAAGQLEAIGNSAGRAPEECFDRDWAKTVVRRVEQRLDEEFKPGEQASLFAALRAYIREDVPAGLYEELTRTEALTLPALKSFTHRMRKRFGELLREEIGETVATRAEIDEELRHLVQVLRK